MLKIITTDGVIEIEKEHKPLFSYDDDNFKINVTLEFSGSFNFLKEIKNKINSQNLKEIIFKDETILKIENGLTNVSSSIRAEGMLSGLNDNKENKIVIQINYFEG